MRAGTVRLAVRIAVVFALVLGHVPDAAAQERFQLMRVGRVFLDGIDPAPDGERVVDLYLRAETLIGEPVARLEPGNVSIRDNGTLIDASKVTVKKLSEAGRGTSSVLVLDISRTMRGEPFEQAKAAALRFLDQTGDYDHVAVVAFGDRAEVVSDFGAPRTALRLAIEQLEVQPKTLSKLVWDGADRAIDMLRTRPPSLPRRSFIILFSDGRDSNSIISLDEAIERAAGKANQDRIPIFSIGYSRFGGRGLEGLDRLSQETGGSSFQAQSPDELGRFFGEVWKRMSESFVVRYPGQLDGLRHTVEVGIESQRDSREASFPEVSTPIWPWLLGVLALVLAGGGVFFFLQNRSSGKLVLTTGERSGESFVLKPGRMRVGALEDNDVVLNFPSVSRYHAQIVSKGGRVELEDLGSRNGTFANGTPVRTRVALESGDRVRFGDVELAFKR